MGRAKDDNRKAWEICNFLMLVLQSEEITWRGLRRCKREKIKARSVPKKKVDKMETEGQEEAEG